MSTNYLEVVLNVMGILLEFLSCKYKILLCVSHTLLSVSDIEYFTTLQYIINTFGVPNQVSRQN